MNHGHGFALALVLTGLALVGSPPAHALTAYDPPTLSVINTGYFNVVLETQAGPSGAPAGFSLEWMTQADYQRLGGWPTDPADPALHECVFTGTPTLHLGDGATTYRLEPGMSVRTEPGDFFDDTGISTEYTGPLVPGTSYVLRAYALGDANGQQSGYTATITVSTMSAECTQGFWKNHPDLWPPLALPMLLGTVSYTKTELLSIFDLPAGGNGLVSLAHQLIAAKLNIANGSDPTPIASTIAAADALIGSLVVPPVGSGYLAPSSTDALTQALDDYNNGRLGGVLPCPTPAHRASWGSVKQLYR